MTMRVWLATFAQHSPAGRVRTTLRTNNQSFDMLTDTLVSHEGHGLENGTLQACMSNIIF